MNVVTLPPEQAAARSWVRAGETGETGSPSHLADELRAHALALGPATRTSLVRRVTRLLAPAATPAERVEEICRALERRGDLLAGPGGTVAPAPLRLVETTGQRWLVVGCLPTVALRRLLPGVDVSAGIGRTARAALATSEDVRAAVEGHGGRVLSAEDWAGLSRTPPADAAWIDELQLRLGNEDPGAAGGLSTLWDEPSVYVPSAEGTTGPRWQRRTTTEAPSLLRARQPGSWWAYAFGQLHGPGKAPRPFLPLSRDEARRTELALDRSAGVPRSLTPAQENGLWWVALDVLVPLAEYRYLLALAEARDEEGSPVKLGFETSAWERAAGMLAERLGLRTEHRQGTPAAPARLPAVEPSR